MDEDKRLSIEAQLTHIVNLFSHSIDKRRYEDLVNIFTEDGEFDRVGQVLKGREAILEAMHNRHPYLTRHAVMNLLFTRVEEDEAEATMYVANFVGQPETEGLPVAYAMEPAFLEFDDLYRRTEEGWKIARRTARVIMKGDKSGH